MGGDEAADDVALTPLSQGFSLKVLSDSALLNVLNADVFLMESLWMNASDDALEHQKYPSVTQLDDTVSDY